MGFLSWLSDVRYKKKYYDRRANCLDLQIDEFVYVRNEAGHKMQNVKKGPYKVIEVDNENCIILKDGKKVKYHKNMLSK